MRHEPIDLPRADWRRPSARQRVLVIGLTLLAELLFLLMLLGLGPDEWMKPRGTGRTTTVDLIPAAEPDPVTTSEDPAAEAETRPEDDPPPRPVLPPSVLPPTAKTPWIELSAKELAAADISKLGTAGGQVASAAKGETTPSAGTGPGGVTLYAAEWYREPTDAELAGYLPPRSIAPGSWAEVACKTIPDNRVENCQAMGESPPGSGLARAIRLAGWQFRIRPPRIDGKPQVGTWVRVHIEFTR